MPASPKGETHPLFTPILEALKRDRHRDSTTVEPGVVILAAHDVIDAIVASDYAVVLKDDLRTVLSETAVWYALNDELMHRLEEALAEGSQRRWVFQGDLLPLAQLDPDRRWPPPSDEEGQADA